MVGAIIVEVIWKKVNILKKQNNKIKANTRRGTNWMQWEHKYIQANHRRGANWMQWVHACSERGQANEPPQQKLGWQFTAGCTLWKLTSVFNFLLHFWLPIPKIFRKVDVLWLEVSCGDSGLWFGLIKMARLLGVLHSKKSNTKTVCELEQLSQRTNMKIDLGFQVFASLLIVKSKILWKSLCVETWSFLWW